MKVIVSGLINIETTVRIDKFPIPYYPIDYPFYGIKSNIAGVAYNVARAFLVLGNDVELLSFIGKDEEGVRIKNRLMQDGISYQYVLEELEETPASVILFDKEGKRQIYCDLKDIQEKQLECSKIEQEISDADVIIACNANINRPLLKAAKKMGKRIATDVHVLSNLEDEYNREFMQYADILFLSDELLPCNPEDFILQLKEKYPCEIIVIGLGEKGALLYDRSTDRLNMLEAVKTETVVNTVGAGDALFTSFLNFYVKGYNSIEALKRAQIFAALKIGHNGAAIGFSTEEEIEEFYTKK